MWDVIRDVLRFHTILQPGEGVELIACDFTDAFYMVPLAGDEQRYYAAMHDNEVDVWGACGTGVLKRTQHIRQIISVGWTPFSKLLRRRATHAYANL